jgi:hypothetical protein
MPLPSDNGRYSSSERRGKSPRPDVDGHHLDQGFVDHRIHHRLHLGIQPVDIALGVLDPNELLPDPPSSFENRGDRRVDLWPVGGVDPVQPGRAVVGFAGVLRTGKQVARGAVGVADLPFTIDRHHQDGQGVEQNFHSVSEPLCVIGKGSLRFEQRDILEDRTDRRRGEAEAKQNVAPHEGRVVELARPGEIHMGDGAQEECNAEPDLARLPLLAATQHRNHSRKGKDGCQTRLERADAGYQTAIAQIGEDRPHHDRE